MCIRDRPGSERHGAYDTASFCLLEETAGVEGQARLLLQQGRGSPVCHWVSNHRLYILSLVEGGVK